MDIQNKFSKSVAGVAFVTFSILLIPLVAMLLTDEVVWTLTDFIVAGILIFGTGFTYKLITLNKSNNFYKSAAGLALGTPFVLVWANLAVGIIGSEDNPANLMYFGVLAVVIIGSVIAKLRPKGMTKAMVSTAVAQLLVTIIALISGMQNLSESFVMEIIIINGFLILLWSTSGLLFRYSAEK